LGIASLIFGCAFLMFQYFICLVLHELTHALVAKKLGYKIGKIKLQATGATLEAESDEFSFSDEIWISISGPLFNFCFSMMILALWWVKPELYNYTQDLFVINLSICFFNLVPIFPLDGGRIVLAFLSKKMQRKNAVKFSKVITLVFSLLLFIIFIFSLFSQPNFGIGIMSVALFLGGTNEDKQASYKRVLFMPRKIERINKAGVESREIYVSQNLDKRKLLRMINSRYYTRFIVVDDDFKVIESFSENDLVKTIGAKGA